VKFWRRRDLIWGVAVAFLVLAVAGSAQAQDDAKPDAKHESQLRSVHGQVSDKAENPMPGGVVFLKNTRTNAVRSYIADDTGSYKFSGLDPNTDYEIHAEKDGAKSPTRQISSFESRKEVVVNLKIDKKS
jgi:Carboxypeptidase regulatory-like domain